MVTDPARDAWAHRSPFVGRTHELAELRRALDDAYERRTRVVLIPGDPGIGKTRLANEIAEEAAQRGAAVLWGRCWEGGGAPAYWPWVQVLRACSTHESVDPLIAGEAAALERRLAPDTRRQATPEPRVEPTRFDLFDETTRLVRHLAASGVAVIVLDDLHAADEPSLHLMLFLARELRNASVLVVGTYRDAATRQSPALARHLAALSRESRVLPLRGLSDAEVGEFVAALVEAPPPDTLVDELCRVTEGNPFFLDEIVRLWRAGKGRNVPDRLPIPDQVRDAIRYRLEPLGDAILNVLRVAAVLGREFEQRIVERLVAADAAPSVYRCLTEAVAAGVVHEMPTQLGRYRFSHALIVDTLYADLGSPERAAVHCAAAAGLERLYAAALDAHAAEIAEHHLRAGRSGDAHSAVAFALRAGRRAMRVLAYEDAAYWFERADKVMDELGAEPLAQAQVWLDIGEAHRLAGSFAQAAPAFQRVVAVARRHGLREAFVEAVLGIGQVAAETGVVNANLVALLEQALTWLPEEDSAVRVRLLGRLAVALYFSPSDPRRELASRDAVAMARRLDDAGVLTVALRTRHFSLWKPGAAEERLALAREMLRLGERIGDVEAQFGGLNWGVIDQLELGQIQAAREDLAAYGQLAAEHHAPREQWNVTLLRSALALYQGDLSSGEYLAKTAFALGDRWEVANAAQFLSVQTFILFRELDRLQELEGSVRTLVERLPNLPVWRCGLALLYAETGKREAAQRELALLAAHDFADLPADANWIPALCLLAEIAAATKDAARAQTLLDLLRPHSGCTSVFGTGAACAGSVTYYLGLLAATVGKTDEAASWFAAAEHTHTEAGAFPWIIRGHVAEVEMGLRFGVAVDAPLARLHAVLDGLVLPRLQRQVEEIEASLRERRKPGPAAIQFEQAGEYWSLHGTGEPFLLQDTKGLRYLAHLLRHPRDEFGAATLQQLGEGHSKTRIDAAVCAERAELEVLQSELAEAVSFNDLGRIERTRAQISDLARRATSRSEAEAPAAEKARLNVTRAILAAVRRIRAQDEVLGRYLATNVHTGSVCCFQAGPWPPK